MPAGNRTGPMGKGPMSGRGMGGSGGAEAQGDARPGGMGRGHGRGRGRGFQGDLGGGGRHGWRHCFNATGLPGWMRSVFGQAEKLPSASGTDQQDLQRQAQALREQLALIEEQLKASGAAAEGDASR